ncbi:MAG: FAD-binding oxidoreductase [Armatimonadota bacterium]|nr:FAD-binding oxidoreductase [Armatimonadota bacterium]
MTQDLIKPFSSDYIDYLHDESRRVGTADFIAFPTTEAEVIEALREAHTRRIVVTTQGARTGLVAGAVPRGGLVLNLSRMNAIGEIRGEPGGHRLTVQPGATLAEICRVVEAQGLLFPPDPTETSASIGGMVASNASGALTFHYGSTRNWVESLRVVLSDGSVLHIRRGKNHARGRSFALTTEDGRVISGDLPSCTQPNVKSAAGYYVAEDMDLIDLFIGMEGTLGVITEIELKLIPRPQAIHGLTIFLPSEDAALKFVRAARGEGVADRPGTPFPDASSRISDPPPLATRPVAIEFFNSDALNLLRRAKSDNPAFADIPALRPNYHTAIYIEFHGESDEELEEAVLRVTDVLANLGVSDDDTWYATSDRELEPIKAFRHAIPEAVNLLIDERKRSSAELTKLGTDMSVPDECLEAVMSMYNSDLAANGLESVIFGHIGNNHAHVNILPNSVEEYERGKSLYLSWARRIVEMGGSVSAEHGIGKLKAPFLALMYGEVAIAQMRALRALFDPDGMLNRGNLF